MDVLLWVLGVGFTINFALMGFFNQRLNRFEDFVSQRFSKAEDDMNQRFAKAEDVMNQRFAKAEDVMNQRFAKAEDTMNQRFTKAEGDLKEGCGNLSIQISKLDEKVTDMDRRLCRLEGAFSSKECCMIKDDRQLRKVE